MAMGHGIRSSLPTDPGHVRSRQIDRFPMRQINEWRVGARLSAFWNDDTAAMAAKYPFGRIRFSAAMVHQMLHLRAAVIADACEHFIWFGRGVGHRRWMADKPDRRWAIWDTPENKPLTEVARLRRRQRRRSDSIVQCAAWVKRRHATVGSMRKKPSLFRFAVNKLAMDLSSAVVDNQYFKVLIVPKAFVAEVLRDLFAILDCFSIRVELKADAVPHRDAVFHIEKKLSHGQSSISQ
jgi:hypothetical protein